MSATKLYPVTVTRPDGSTKRKRYAVLIRGGEHDGLTVFDQPDRVWFHAPVNWAELTVPTTLADRKQGFDVPLTSGEVVRVQVAGCSTCGSLSRWAGPLWASGVGG